MHWEGGSPQLSIGKSFEGFASIGPVLSTPGELGNPENLRISTTIHGTDGAATVVQNGGIDQLISGIAVLISRLSTVVELRPGDLIFTGTPSGIGAAMDLKRFVEHDERLVTEIEGIGTIEERFHARGSPATGQHPHIR